MLMACFRSLSLHCILLCGFHARLSDSLHAPPRRAWNVPPGGHGHTPHLMTIAPDGELNVPKGLLMQPADEEASTWQVKIPDTTMGGSMIHHGNQKEPVTLKLDLGNNDWIVGHKSSTHIKMVKIHITGAATFTWIATRYDNCDNCICGNPATFTEACFKGTDPGNEFYIVFLVADQAHVWDGTSAGAEVTIQDDTGRYLTAGPFASNGMTTTTWSDSFTDSAVWVSTPGPYLRSKTLVGMAGGVASTEWAQRDHNGYWYLSRCTNMNQWTGSSEKVSSYSNGLLVMPQCSTPDGLKVSITLYEASSCDIRSGESVYLQARTFGHEYVEVSGHVGGGYGVSTRATKSAAAEFKIFKWSGGSGNVQSGESVYLQEMSHANQYVEVSGRAGGGYGVSTRATKSAAAEFKIFKWSGGSGNVQSSERVYLQAMTNGNEYVEVSGRAGGGYGISTRATKSAEAEFQMNLWTPCQAGATTGAVENKGCGVHCEDCNSDTQVCRQCAAGKFLSSSGECITKCPVGEYELGGPSAGATCERCYGKTTRDSEGRAKGEASCTPCGRGEVGKSGTDDCHNIQEECSKEQCEKCVDCMDDVEHLLEECVDTQAPGATCVNFNEIWCSTWMTQIQYCESFSMGCYFKLLCHSPCICDQWKMKKCGGSMSGGTCDKVTLAQIRSGLLSRNGTSPHKLQSLMMRRSSPASREHSPEASLEESLMDKRSKC